MPLQYEEGRRIYLSKKFCQLHLTITPSPYNMSKAEEYINRKNEIMKNTSLGGSHITKRPVEKTVLKATKVTIS